MQALMKAPDCFTMVASLLEPHELQHMRCVSKESFRAITKETMLQCIKNTIARYAGPHAMPDGVVRFYSVFGKSVFDICKVEGVYQLKQEGFQVKKLDSVIWDNPHGFETTLDFLLSRKGIRLSQSSSFVLDRHETAFLCFEVKTTTDAAPNMAKAFFRFKQPPTASPARPDSETLKHMFWDFDFYRIRLNAKMPSPLLKIFEINEKTRTVEVLKSEIHTLLTDLERTHADGADEILKARSRVRTLEDVKSVLQEMLSALKRIYAH
jgi:hypothetical protein